ncbi:LOW QUALITY PROTEIN: hypothetical protein OSB04_un001833 [Centaurea solstitialis]|uniref:Ubiquitin-like domain-containing protein n=1 Tax=Centaurea solstitialis TaxID=347529 RepID=A0AA38SEZ9_9ASTR|nr:LOW QUALITY PROTEIN: hypothetical protein OSB04_un001833 [Centaurea solstitialis]
MDVSDIVEEDEEAFLKGSLEGFSYMRRAHVLQDDLLTSQEDKQELPKSGTVDADEMVDPEVDDQREGYFHDVLPLNGNTGWICLRTGINLSLMTISLSISKTGKIESSSIILQLETSGGSCEISGPESEGEGSKESDLLNKPLKSKARLDLRADEEDNGHFCRSRPVSLEPFGSRKSTKSYSSSEEAIYHPQLLRLESRLEADDTHRLGGKKMVRLKVIPLSALTSLLYAIMMCLMGSWMERVVWEPHQSVSKPKLLLDLQDEQMLFEVLDNKDGEHLQLHAGAMITTRSLSLLVLHGYGGQSGARFNIANDKFYSNRKSSQQLKSHSKKRAAHGVKILHSIPALKLQTMKAKLSNKDIAYFHRPKALWYPHDNVVALKEQGKLLTKGSMKVVLKSLGGKGSKLHVDAEETILSLKGKATKKLDFKPSEPVKIIYSGKELEDEKSLAEQDTKFFAASCSHENTFVTRAQKLPGENKSLRPPGAFKKKSDLSARDGHLFLME